jgi:hypothetical protein
MLGTGLYVHEVASLEFETIRGALGGSLVIRAYDTGTRDYVYVNFGTSDPAVFDHFRDIERLTTGPIGSLHTEPTTEPTS